jgi:hypothetical protein
MSDTDSDESPDWETARRAAIEAVLGKADDVVGHSPVPLDFGADIGGAADVIYFRNHLPGVVSVTDDLIGRDNQKQTSLGNYELMICERDDAEWGSSVISKLAAYTFQARLEPGQTMDIRRGVPEGSSVEAVLFQEYARFEVLGRPCGLLLLIGITGPELAACRRGRRREVEAALQAANISPYTDLRRPSVDIGPGKSWFTRLLGK